MATPQENRQRFQEIANRGLADRLDPDKRARFDEAVRRGLIQMPTDITAPTAPAAQTQPQEVQSNIFREIADIPINLASGVATGTRLLADLAGAGNPVSESIRGVEGFLQSILSAQAKADQQEVGRIMARAEDMGVGAQVRAGLRAFMVSPLDFTAQGLGTIVPGVVAGVFAGIPGLIGYGVGSGVGLVKGAVFDAVNEALLEQDKSPEEARAAALEAQSYAGDNLDMIALGGVFGYAATRFGVQPALISKKLGDRLIKAGVPPTVARSAINEAAAEETLKRGVLGNLGRTAVIEGTTEAAQAGQERFAQNLALQREGMDVPLMRGVVSSAALEGAIGAIIGGGVGTVEAQRADTTLAERRAARGTDPGLEVDPETLPPQQTPLELEGAGLEADPEISTLTEEQRQAAVEAAFLDDIIAPTPPPTPVDRSVWEPAVTAQVEADSQTEFDQGTIIDNSGRIASQYGLEARDAYIQAMTARLETTPRLSVSPTAGAVAAEPVVEPVVEEESPLPTYAQVTQPDLEAWNSSFKPTGLKGVDELIRDDFIAGYRAGAFGLVTPEQIAQIDDLGMRQGAQQGARVAGKFSDAPVSQADLDAAKTRVEKNIARDAERKAENEARIQEQEQRSKQDFDQAVQAQEQRQKEETQRQNAVFTQVDTDSVATKTNYRAKSWIAANIVGKTRAEVEQLTKANPELLTETGTRAKFLQALLSPQEALDLGTTPVVEEEAPKPGPGRPKLELTPEQQEKRSALSRAAGTEGKAQSNDFVRVREAVERAETLLARPKFAEVFPTQEAFDAYDANPKAALVSEVAANIEAGMTPPAARKSAIKTLGTYDSVKKALRENRAKLVAALAQVIKTATSKRLANTDRQKEALRVLQDPSISAEDITAAVELAQEAGLKVDESQFGRQAPAIPAKSQRVPTTTEPQVETEADVETEAAADAATKAEVEADVKAQEALQKETDKKLAAADAATKAEVEADVKAQEALQKETDKKLAAVEKDKTLVGDELLPEALLEETTATGLFDAISKLDGATVFERQLARILKRMTKIAGTKVVVFSDPETLPADIRNIFVKDGKIVTAGLYEPVSGTIYLHAKEGGDIRTALHEGVHAVTVDMIDSYIDPKKRGEVPEASQKAIEGLLELMVAAGDRYAQLKLSGRTSPELDTAAQRTENFTDLKEFLSYGLTTPALQRMLLGMPPVSKGFIKDIVSAFSDLAAAVMGMLGMPTATNYTAFEQLIDLTGVVAAQNAMAPYKASEVAQAKAQKKQISSLMQAVALRSGSIDAVLKNQKKVSDFISTFMRDPKAGVDMMLNAGKYVTGRAYRAMLRVMDTNMLNSLAKRRGIGMADRLATIMQELDVYRSRKINEASKIAGGWDSYVTKNPDNNELLNNVFRLSTVFNILIYDVDTKSFVSLKDSIARDQKATALRDRVAELNKITGRTQPENTALTIAKKALADREQSITDMFKNYVEPLRAKPNGDAGMDIYAQTQDKHRADLNEAIELMRTDIRNDGNISGTEADPATDKGRLMSGLNDLFADMKLLNSYSPLSRPGKFAVRVKDKKGKQLFNISLETDFARDSFMKSYLKSNPEHKLKTIDLGENQADNMRELLQGDNKKLSDLFTMLDSVQSAGPEAVVEIKDALYQMYLATLPSGAARKATMHRTNDLGYDGDALRAFGINQSAIVNQLARLKYASQVRNEVSAGREQVADMPSTDVNERDMKAIVEVLAERASTTLSPPKMGSAEAAADAASRLGTRAGFLWMLTSMRSAAIQPTQLVIFGFGGLHAKYGAGKTAAMAAKYMGNFLTANALSRTVVDESGKVLDEKGTAAIRNSKYVNASPIKDALQKAYDIGDLNNTYQNTRTSSIMEVADAKESELRQAGGRGGLSKAAKFGMGLVSAPIYHTERVSREVFFMSTFELEYEKVLARGLSGDAAVESAAQTAMELTKKLMFDYSALNKPSFAKTWYGRNGYQFMTFQVQATAHIVINFYKAFAASGFTRAEKREAAIMFWDTMAMGALFSGVTGIFGYTAMVALLDGLRDALRPDVDDEDADLFYDIDDAGNPLGLRSIDLYIRNHVLNKYFGPGSSLANFMGLTPEQAQRMQRAVEFGLPNALTDLNAQASLELDGLIYRGPDGRDRSSEDTVVNLAFDTILGPSASVVRNFAKGYDTIVDDGDISRGLEMMMPAFLREPMKAMRFATEGNITRGGDELKPQEFYTGWKVVGQSLGFGSTEVAESQVSTFAARKLSDEIKAEKKAVYDNFEKAFNERNDAVDKHGPESRQVTTANNKFNDALQEVRRYNYKNFFDAIKPDDLEASLRERLRRQGLTDEGFYLGDAVAPYLYRIMMPSRSVTNPPEDVL